MMILKNAFLWASAYGLVALQFPPKLEGLTTVQSRLHPGASISCKQTQICETTPGVKSFSGYVHLPATLDPTVAPYPNSLFFWFFESRKDPANAPFAIWINGGPGFSSLVSVGSENGPCNINEDSNSTTLNPWSWNNEVNMLYIDQPTQTGFSYDVLTNGTLDQITSIITPADFSRGTPESNNSFLAGTFASQDQNSTANTTQNGAHALWYFVQTWLEEFPAYRPAEDKVHLWTESFGGKFAPTYTAYFQEQIKKINSMARKSKAIPIQIATIGVVNGCTHMLTQAGFYPEIAYNNTYGIKAITLDEYKASKLAFSKSGGCASLTEKCRALATKFDPGNHGNVPLVNEACIAADNYCATFVLGPYFATKRDPFDLAQYPTTTFPPPFLVGFYNQHWVQAALGVPVNFTVGSNGVTDAFAATGDLLISRGGTMDQWSYAIESGVKVAMMYGDRDYTCSCKLTGNYGKLVFSMPMLIIPTRLGGENVTLNIKHPGQHQFQSAGYEKIQTNDSYVGGLVRQAGPLSFSRVFEAGHLVPGFQPETAYRIFMRTMQERDVATGSVAVGNRKYQTHGPSSVFDIKNAIPPSAPVQCYLWQLSTTCTPNQIKAVANGTAVVRDYIVVEPES